MRVWGAGFSPFIKGPFFPSICFRSLCEGVPAPEWAIHSVIARQEVNLALSRLVAAEVAVAGYLIIEMKLEIKTELCTELLR